MVFDSLLRPLLYVVCCMICVVCCMFCALCCCTARWLGDVVGLVVLVLSVSFGGSCDLLFVLVVECILVYWFVLLLYVACVLLCCCVLWCVCIFVWLRGWVRKVSAELFCRGHVV